VVSLDLALSGVCFEMSDEAITIEQTNVTPGTYYLLLIYIIKLLILL